MSSRSDYSLPEVRRVLRPFGAEESGVDIPLSSSLERSAKETGSPRSMLERHDLVKGNSQANPCHRAKPRRARSPGGARDAEQPLREEMRFEARSRSG